MKRIITALIALAVIAAGSAPAFAGHVRTRIWIGPGWGPGWYGRHHYYPYQYPYVVEQPTVIVRPPEVYVQPVPPQERQPEYYWYYCQNPQGYYPYVQSCPEGWMKVVPTPPQPQEQKR